MATVGRGAEQYTVRFPDGLRDRIKAAADASGRSMNAEIIKRLEDSFDAPVLGEEQVLLIVIDADGHPQSWDETFEHVRAIRKAGAFSPSVMNTLVYNGPRVSSTTTEEKVEKLARWYRNYQRKNRLNNNFLPSPHDQSDQ